MYGQEMLGAHSRIRLDCIGPLYPLTLLHRAYIPKSMKSADLLPIEL
jgi:hypothetical protein